jgi:hypothetical protein
MQDMNPFATRKLNRQLAKSTWKKSSLSDYNGSCVEITRLPDGRVAVRDTKDNKKGPVMTYGPKAWEGLLHSIKANDLSFYAELPEGHRSRVAQ